MAIKMRISKDKYFVCNACGNDRSKSVEVFDLAFQIPDQNACIMHLCDKCVSELMDKTLKARCKVDGMVKTPQQIRVINGRKQAEMRIREKAEAEELKRLKEVYGQDE